VSFTLPFDISMVVLGLVALLWRPSPAWVEQTFVDGYYPKWQYFLAMLTEGIPFAVGDFVLLAGIVIVIAAIAFVRPFWRTILGIAGLGGFFTLWFYAGWGYGYDRAPVEARADFQPSRLTPATIDALRKRIIARMNALAPEAHGVVTRDRLEYGRLRLAWLPVVQRLGDDWVPKVSPAKPTLAGWFMDRSGTSGFTNPFTLETQLAPDLLWFERPFSQAHEWSHVAGYNREDEANYIAAVTCLRDPDPVAQYSGALELFLYLPALKHYPHSMFVQQVWNDFASIRERNAHFVNLNVSRFSWRVYNSYLKSNHIASGVQNYDQVTRLMAGIPLDAQGLPVSAPTLSASTPVGNR